MSNEILKEKLKKISKEFKYNFESSVINSKNISINNNKTLIKKLKHNRDVITYSFNLDTSIYKKL